MIPSIGSALGGVPGFVTFRWMVMGERLRQTGKVRVVLATGSLSLSSDEEGEGGSDGAGGGPPDAVTDRSMGVSVDEGARRVSTR